MQSLLDNMCYKKITTKINITRIQGLYYRYKIKLNYSKKKNNIDKSKTYQLFKYWQKKNILIYEDKTTLEVNRRNDNK